MADFFNATTDFEPEIPHYLNETPEEAAEAEEQLKQQQMAVQM